MNTCLFAVFFSFLFLFSTRYCSFDLTITVHDYKTESGFSLFSEVSHRIHVHVLVLLINWYLGFFFTFQFTHDYVNAFQGHIHFFNGDFVTRFVESVISYIYKYYNNIGANHLDELNDGSWISQRLSKRIVYILLTFKSKCLYWIRRTCHIWEK